MGTSNAERQAKYRERHLKNENGALERLNMMVDHTAKLKLKRLASCYGVTQREMLERVLGEFERVLLEKLSSADSDDYYDCKLIVTQ